MKVSFLNLGPLYIRVRVQENPKIEQSYWPRAENWTQGLYTRVQDQETHPSPKMMWRLSGMVLEGKFWTQALDPRLQRSAPVLKNQFPNLDPIKTGPTIEPKRALH